MFHRVVVEARTQECLSSILEYHHPRRHVQSGAGQTESTAFITTSDMIDEINLGLPETNLLKAAELLSHPNRAG